MSRELPSFLASYLPKGHRLWFSPQRDLEAEKPPALRNPNATGGTNRRDWVLCVCGGGYRLPEQVAPDGTREPMEPTDDDWLAAINQCRLAVHTTRQPCPPVTLEGQELPVRETPPHVQPIAVSAPAVEEAAAEEPAKRPVGRPRKEQVHA